jgi:hypothetical protein
MNVQMRKKIKMETQGREIKGEVNKETGIRQE